MAIHIDIRKFLSLWLFLSLLGGYVTAQIYPVQVTTQLVPPYSPYLADYTAPGSQRLMVQLRSNDVTLADYRIKLRLTIEGVGITVRTRPTFVPQPITLPDGGAPLLLYGEDLLEYFNPNNLEFMGLTRSQFQQTGKLPEGVYRISFEALDYNRNTVVGNRGMTVAWMILNDPPLLNLPRKEYKLLIVDPLNIPFTWTPRHTASPNAAFNTEYIFRLVEIWPANRNPYDAFLSQPPLYEVTTSQSQIIYGIAEPALIPGRKYAWQVQAVDVEGRDLFKNQGRSEVFVFQYGDELGVPENLRSEAANAATISIRWDPSAVGEMPEQYRIRYRTPGAITWHELISRTSWTTLTQLQANSEYDVQVRGERQGRVGEYTAMQRLQTAEAVQNADYNCGQSITFQPDTVATPLVKLNPGDSFTCADFEVMVTEMSEERDGVFSGLGLVKIYLLSGARVEVRFSGNINNKYVMTSGSVESTYEQGSAIGQAVDQMYDIGEDLPEQPVLSGDSTTTITTIDYVVPGVIDSLFVNEDGRIEVIDEEGNVTTYEVNTDPETGGVRETVLTDSGGNTYTVDQNGNVGSTGSSAGAGSSPSGGGPAHGSSPPSVDLDLLKKLLREVMNEFNAEVKSQIR